MVRGTVKEHAQKQVEHFRDRAKERFHLKVDKQIRSSIIKSIERGRSILISKQGNRETHSLAVGKNIVYVVYDKVTMELVTIMYSGRQVRSALVRGNSWREQVGG